VIQPSDKSSKAGVDKIQIYEQAYLAETLGETLHPGGLALTQHALSLCSLPTAARVLDVGCGAGRTVQHLTDKGLQAWGVDRSSLLLQAGHQRVAALPLFQADVTCLPFPAGCLDAIVAECSLSVFTSANQASIEFHRLLVQDGTLILTDLYVRNPAGLENLRAACPCGCLAGAFVQEELFSLLVKNGFTPLIWEDHSQALKSLPGQTLSTLLYGAQESGMDAMDRLLSIASAKPGYFICISKKC
jgi:SAM-dependent methyltransferase